MRIGRKTFLGLSALLVIAAAPVSATTAVFAGLARVHDGDTIRVAGTSVRLWGIDAVELKQTCGYRGVDIPCGVLARAAMENIIAGGEVVCTQRGKSYKRAVAVCTVQGRDIGHEMVRLGMAFDSARYSKGFYAQAQDRARAANAGLWAMNVQDPAQWRACHKGRKTAYCGT